MFNFRYWIASFPPSPTSKLIQIQFWPGPRVSNQPMTCWWVMVSGLLGPELANTRLQIRLLLRRNPRRKWGTGHLESRSTIWLPTHLLLQLFQKVLGKDPFRSIQQVGLTWTFHCAGFFFLTWPIVQDPVGYLSRLLCEGSWVKWRDPKGWG
jgi:hypothetical protein